VKLRHGVGRPFRRYSLAAAALLVVFGLSGCTDNENRRRLGVLEGDPVRHCQLTGVQPWEEIASAGTRHGIGFGGIAPTLVGLNWHLTGDAATVATALRTCAVAAGWAIDRSSAGGAMFSARKTFEGKWTASLVVGVGQHAYRGKPAASVTIETDPV
jgi:hypothetical protein